MNPLFLWESNLFYSFFLNAIYLYSKTTVFIEKKKKYVFETFPFLKTSMNTCSQFFSKTYAFLENRRMEPFYENWISNSSLVVYDLYNRRNTRDDLQDQYILEETYEKTKTNSLYFDSNSISKTMRENPYLIESLVISKYEDKYNCFVINKLTPCYHEINREPCKNPFLIIEYHHKNMKDSIPIHLDKGYFIVGNQLLSKSFVLRYLEYNIGSLFPQSYEEPFFYDFDYEIHIIDHNVHSFILKSDEYIVLEKNNYFVRKNY